MPELTTDILELHPNLRKMINDKYIDYFKTKDVENYIANNNLSNVIKVIKRRWWERDIIEVAGQKANVTNEKQVNEYSQQISDIELQPNLYQTNTNRYSQEIANRGLTHQYSMFRKGWDLYNNTKDKQTKDLILEINNKVKQNEISEQDAKLCIAGIKAAEVPLLTTCSGCFLKYCSSLKLPLTSPNHSLNNIEISQGRN